MRVVLKFFKTIFRFIIKHFLIIAILLIASGSYYGIANKKGEKVNKIEEVMQINNSIDTNTNEETKESNASEVKTEEKAINVVAKEVSQTAEKTDKKNESPKQEKTNSISSSKTKATTNTTKTTKKETKEVAKQTTKQETKKETQAKEEKKKTEVNNKKETSEEPKNANTKETMKVQETKVNKSKFVRNDQMINKIKQIIINNESPDMKEYGYTIVIDPEVKKVSNGFTFTEKRVKSAVYNNFGTIRIYAEDYYDSNGDFIMTDCYIH